jgi:hypothetical protein
MVGNFIFSTTGQKVPPVFDSAHYTNIPVFRFPIIILKDLFISEMMFLLGIKKNLSCHVFLALSMPGFA